MAFEFTKENLKRLLEKNPNVEIINGQNALFVRLGDYKVVYRADVGTIKELTKGLKGIRSVNDLAPSERRFLRDYQPTTELNHVVFEQVEKKIRQRQQSAWKLNPPDGSKKPFIPRVTPYSYKTKEPIKAISYVDLAGVSLNEIVNDFFTTYFDPGSSINGLDVSAAFDTYAKGKDVGVDKININKSIKKQVEKLYDSIKKDPKLLTELKEAKSELLTREVKLSDYGPEELRKSKVYQSIIDIGGTKVLFTDKQMKQDSLAKLGITMKQLLNIEDGTGVKIVTPNKTHYIVPRGDKVSVDGFLHEAKVVTKEDLKRRYFENTGLQRRVNLADAERYFTEQQHELRKPAIKAIKEGLTSLTAGMTPAEVDKFLKETTVEQFKKVMSFMDFSTDTLIEGDLKVKKGNLRNTYFEKLKKYIIDDRVSLNKVLPKETLKELKLNAVNSRLELAKNKAYENTKSTVKKAANLGISSKDILKDLDEITGGRLSKSKDFKEAIRPMNKTQLKTYLNVLREVDNTISQTKKPFDFKDKFARTKVAEAKSLIVKSIFKKDGVKALESRGLLSPTLENPLVNLEGRLKSNHVREILAEVIKDITTSNRNNTNTEAIARLGEMLSSRDIKYAEGKKAKRLGLKGIEAMFFEEMDALASNMALKEFGKDYTLRDKRLIFNDIAYDVKEALGGNVGVDEVLKAIKGGEKSIEAAKNLRIAKEAFISGESYLPNNFEAIEDKIAIQEELKNLIDKKKADIQAISRLEGEAYEAALKDPNRYANMTTDDLLRLAVENTAPSDPTARGIQDTYGRDIASLGNFLDEIAIKRRDKKLTAADIGELISEANLKGIITNDPKEAYYKLKDLYAKQASELYSGLEYDKGRVAVSFHKALAKDIFRQNKASGRRLKADKLGVVDFISDTKADWSRLVDILHGDKISNLKLIFDDPTEVSKKRLYIINSLRKIPYVDKKAIDKLEAKMNSMDPSIITSYEEQAYDIIKKNSKLVEIPGTGLIEHRLSPSVDAAAVLNTLGKPYGISGSYMPVSAKILPMVTKAGDQFWGRKFLSEIPMADKFTWSFDPETGYKFTSRLTKARANQALSKIKSKGLVGEYSKVLASEAVPLTEALRIIGNYTGAGSSYIRNMGGTLGFEKTASVQKVFNENVNALTKIILEAQKSGDWATYNAYVNAAEKMTSTFNYRSKSSAFNSVTAVNDAISLLTEPKKFLTSQLTSKARKYLNETATSFVVGKGEVLYDGAKNSVVDELKLTKERVEAEALRAELLKYSEIGYGTQLSTTANKLAKELNLDPVAVENKLLKAKVDEALVAKLESLGLANEVDPMDIAIREAEGKIKQAAEAIAERKKAFYNNNIIDYGDVKAKTLFDIEQEIKKNKIKFVQTKPPVKDSVFSIAEGSNGQLIVKENGDIKKVFYSKSGLENWIRGESFAQGKPLKGLEKYSEGLDFSKKEPAKLKTAFWDFKEPFTDIRNYDYPRLVQDIEKYKNLKFRYDSLMEKLTPEKKAKLRNLRTKHFLKFSEGGKIPGQGIKDEVPALLTKGETVIDRKTSEKLGIRSNKDYARFKKAVLAGKIGKFADGGGVYTEAELRDILTKGDFTDRAKIERSLAAISNPHIKKAFELKGFKPKAAGISVGDIEIEKPKSTARPKRKSPFEIDMNNALTDASAEYKLVADNVAIHMKGNKPKVEIINGSGNPFDNKYIKDMIEQSTLSPADKAKALSNLSAQILEEMGSKLGLSGAELKAIANVGSPFSSMKPADLAPQTIAKIKELDANLVQETLDGAKDLKLNQVKDLERGLKQAIGTRGQVLKTSTRITPFERAAKELELSANTLGQVLGKDPNVFKGLGDLAKTNPKAVAEQLAKEFKGFNFEKVNTSTSSMTTSRIRNIADSLASLDKMLGDDAFLDYGLRQERSGLRSIKKRFQEAENLRDRSRTRFSEFGALTMQNAAFLGSYMAIGGVQTAMAGTIGFMASFDDAMKNLQAITGDTADGLRVMTDAVEQVSTTTKFSALEIADAATIMGQAGFSAIDISKSLDGVVQLATATGSKLEDATGVLTSTLTIWDKSLTDAKKISNEFTAAINQSKLNIESLTQAIQYTGNIAASASIPVEDVLTMTSLLRDAGIKRGSTLGTGQRLLYSDFATPSKRFIESLKSVGIELDEFTRTFREGGLLETLKLMKSKGYGLSQATRGMEMREKAIYIAAINQLEQFDTFRSNITGTNAAYIANKTQMEGMGNRFKNMINSWQINWNNTLDDFKEPINNILDFLTIDIKKRQPEENIYNKNYSIEDKYKPKSQVHWGVGATALVVGTGLLSKAGFDTLKAAAVNINEVKNIGKFTTSAEGFKGRVPLAYNPSPIQARPSLTGAERLLGGVYNNLSEGSKNLLSRMPSWGMAAGGFGLAALVGAASAPEGFSNKVTGATDAMASMLAWTVGSKAIDKMAEITKNSANPVAARGPRGWINKAGAIGTLMALDAAIAAPLRAEGGWEGAIPTATEGAIGGAVLGANLGKYGGWIGAAAGALIGGVTGYIGGKEAPPIDATTAMSALVNDSKALSSEFETMGKAARDFSDLSNFAIRYSKDASESEKEAKFYTTVELAKNVNKQVRSLESVLVSFADTFKGFGFGQELAATPAAMRAKGKFNYRIYSANGTDITYSIGVADSPAEAQSMEIISAIEAGFKAKAAPGGADANAFAILKSKDFSEFKEAIKSAKSQEERKAILESKGLRPLRDLINKDPVAALTNRGAIEAYVKKLDAAYRDAMPKYTWYGAVKEGYYDERKAVFANLDKMTKGLTDLLEKAGTKAKFPQESIVIAKAQVEKIAKDNGITIAEALTKYLEGTAKSGTQASATIGMYKSLVDKFTPLGQLKDRYSAGINTLDKLSSTTVGRVRDLSIGASKVLTEHTAKFGYTIDSMATLIAKDMVPAMEQYSKAVKANISALGDLTGKSGRLYLDDNKDFRPFDKKQFAKVVSGEAKSESLTMQVKDLVSVFRVDNADRLEFSQKMMGAYSKSEAMVKSFVETIKSFKSLEGARAFGDISLYKTAKTLDNALRKIGLDGINVQDKLLSMPTYDDLKAMAKSYNFLTSRQENLMDIQRGMSIETMNIRAIHAEKLALKQMEFGREKAELSKQRAEEDLKRNYEFNKSRAKESYDRNVRDLNKAIGRLSLKYERGLEDINIRKNRAYEDLVKSTNRALDDVARDYARGAQDILRRQARAYEDLAISGFRAMEKLERNKQYSLEDLYRKRARGYQDIGTSRARGIEDIAINRERGTAAIELNAARRIEDLFIRIGRAREDQIDKENRAEEDLLKTRRRNIEDANRKYQDNIGAISRSYARTLAALERSRSDTIAMFERSLTKPQVVTLDTDALNIIADQLGDVSLALDAHKAALNANTSAVKQNNALQKAQEDITKEAYKDAYKKVGGKVYNDDGTLNEAFAKAYNDYMDKNSESLVDAVLENALNKAYAGVGFSITEALNNPAYIANQVASPTPGITAAGAMLGTGLTEDQLATQLYGVKANEVRISTTTGVILEAQGGMESALFDLQTSLIGIDIQVREAGFSFQASIEEAAIQLQQRLRDIDIQYQRALEDLAESINRQTNDIDKALARGLEDIARAKARDLEDLNIKLAQAMDDLELRLRRAGQDLETSISRGIEDINIGFIRAANELKISLQEAAEDIARNMARAWEDLNIQYQRAVEDVLIREQRAAEDIEVSTSKAVEDLVRGIQRAREDFAITLDDLNQKFKDTISDLDTRFSFDAGTIDINFNRALEDLLDNYNNRVEMIALQMAQQQEMLDIQFNQQREMLIVKGAQLIDSFYSSVETSISNQVYDLARMKANLETQVNEALAKLKIEGDYLLKQVASEFQSIFTGEAAKRLAKQTSDGLVAVLKRGLKLGANADEVAKAISAELDKVFKDKVAKSLKNNAKEVAQQGEAYKKSIDQITELNRQFNTQTNEAIAKTTKTFQDLNQTGVVLQEANNTLAPGINSLKNTTEKLALVGPAVEQSSSILNTASTQMTSASTTLIQATAGINGAALGLEGTLSNSMLNLANSLPPLGNAIDVLARQAINAIVGARNAALAASNQGTSVKKRTGGLIPGYGGGDVVPTLLEPGEYVIRKEIVREFGIEKLNKLNAGTSGVAEEVISTSTSVPSSPQVAKNNINVNIGVNANVSIDAIEQNIDRIADGVRRVFEEYS